MKEHFPILKIDAEFKNLIRPLHQKEFLQLEENLLSDGCRDPIVTWNGIIIDGHNRYAICNKHKIPYTFMEMEFDSRDAVISWICKNQLGRRNITEETRKYLIGKQYNAEKILNHKKNALGANQYTYDDEDFIPNEEELKEISNHKTAQKIANENHITHATVQKYSAYANALNTIQNKEPEMVSRILSGRYKVSHKNLIAIAKMPETEVKSLNGRMGQSNKPFIQYSKTRNILSEAPISGGTVKDMPAYDPDARITELTLTIPSWTSSIIRTKDNIEMDKVSLGAKSRLVTELKTLEDRIQEMITTMKEN